MKTDRKSRWTRKALNCGMVALAIATLLMYPKLAAAAAVALVIAWAMDRRAPKLDASYAAGCANASSSLTVAEAETKPAEKAPSKREVMRCWVALF